MFIKSISQEEIKFGGIFGFWVVLVFFFSNKIAWLNGSQMRSLLQSIVISKTDNWKLSYSNKH